MEWNSFCETDLLILVSKLFIRYNFWTIVILCKSLELFLRKNLNLLKFKLFKKNKETV